MEEKIMLGDFICRLRKEKGMTQEQLAERVGITNKAVSKWETFEANPDLTLLPKIARALDVTTDELLACKREDSKREAENQSNTNHSQNQKSQYAGRVGGMTGTVKRDKYKYEFVSDRKTKKGKPFLHVNLGIEDGRVCRANGVIAVGIISRGIISAGVVSTGLIAFGVFAFGLLALGAFAFGLVAAVGAVAAGIGVSVGSVAVGSLAVGAIAVGVFSVGAIAIGVVAHTGAEGIAIGLTTFIH